MSVIDAAEAFVQQELEVTDNSVLAENVFILSQHILSSFRQAQQSIISKNVEKGELNEYMILS